MFSIVLFSLVIASVYAIPTTLENNRRLIKTSETDVGKWMTPAEVDALSLVSENFIDVTEWVEPKPVTIKRAIPSNPSFPDDVADMLAAIDDDNWWDLVLELEAMGTRHRTSTQGIAAGVLIHERMQTYGAGTNLTVEYELFNHASIPQQSTITRIIGCDASVRDEIVIIGGHEDSTSTPTSNAPGADDDATGSATVMELFRVFASKNFCPRRTLEFHTYAGEEGGLIGSNGIAQSYNGAGVNVISMVQFDMTGYENGGGAVGIIQDYTSPALNTFLTRLLDAYVPDLPYVTNSRCGYGCSDHASWNNRGYPAAFPFEAPFGDHNPSIHTPNDVNSRISKAYGAKFVKLGMSYLVEMALF